MNSRKTQAPSRARPGLSLIPYKTEPSRRCFGAMDALLMPAVAILLAFAGACGQSDATGEVIFTPEVLGTAAVPLSESNEVALLANERIACAIDSYESQVHCVDVEGAVVGVFGRKGGGPGEFGSPSYLARGEEGTVGVHDPELDRFTAFEPSGTYVSDVTVPVSLFTPLRSFGTVLSGVSVDIMAMLGGETSGSLMTRFDVNIASGEVVREEASPSGPWDVSCGQVIYGIPDRTEGWIFVACEGHLIFVDSTSNPTVLRAPTYFAKLPDERDVARFEEYLIGFNRVRGLPDLTSVDEELKSYRATPKKYYLGTQHQLLDAANRYWIATNRDRNEWSYLDVYQNAEYVGSVKVRDRLRGFDLLGSTLVALVDRPVGADDADGFPDRALDWYEIGDLELGR